MATEHADAGVIALLWQHVWVPIVGVLGAIVAWFANRMVNEIREDIEEHDGKLDSIRTDVTLLQAQHEACEAARRAADTRLDGIDGKLDKILWHLMGRRDE